MNSVPRSGKTGVLAVTRSLGDSSMKEFVVGSPYTTETRLGPYDDFLIVACDGVSLSPPLSFSPFDGPLLPLASPPTRPLTTFPPPTQLWDVCSDQEAVDLVADCADDAQAASQKLLDHALNNFSTDNLSVLVVCGLSSPPLLFFSVCLAGCLTRGESWD